MTSVKDVLDSLEYVMEDEDVPKSVTSKMEAIVNDLKSTNQLSLAVNKSISELEDLSEDVNIPPFVRTQIWGVIGQLAALESEIVKSS